MATNVEWYTPEKYIEAVRKVLGGIDLDPASCNVAQQMVKADLYYTKVMDGYRQEWDLDKQGGTRVFCNPPYGRDAYGYYGHSKSAPVAMYWLEKGIQSYRESKIGSAIFLLNRTGAIWYQELLNEVDAVCQVKSRIAFIDKNGKPSESPRYYNDFLYLGEGKQKFQGVFSQFGRVTLKRDKVYPGFTLEGFKDWLEGFKREETVGSIFDPNKCPVDRFMRDLVGDREVRVTAELTVINGDRYVTPDWAKGFLLALNNPVKLWGDTRVTNDDAQALLMSVG